MTRLTETQIAILREEDEHFDKSADDLTEFVEHPYVYVWLIQAIRDDAWIEANLRGNTLQVWHGHKRACLHIMEARRKIREGILL